MASTLTLPRTHPPSLGVDFGCDGSFVAAIQLLAADRLTSLAQSNTTTICLDVFES